MVLEIHTLLVYDESIEQERDAAWDEVNAVFPEAEYIEEF